MLLKPVDLFKVDSVFLEYVILEQQVELKTK